MPPARIDANQLELAILNLAINARDAMPDGGKIDIKVTEYQAKRDPALAPGLSQTVGGGYGDRHVTGNTEAGDRAVLLVEAGWQRHRPRTVHGARARGSLGGTLQLTSTVGKGTCATLVLPVATAAPEAESAAPAAQKIKRSAVILFVDDDPLIAMSTTEMLEVLGHRVIGANSGQHALDILRSEQPST